MPYTPDQFAAEIKAKYPEYQSWPNDYLVKEVIAKHPEYQSWVSSGDVRSQIAARKANPPATATGDPNGQPTTTLDDLAAAGNQTMRDLTLTPLQRIASNIGGMVTGPVKETAHNARAAYQAAKNGDTMGFLGNAAQIASPVGRIVNNYVGGAAQHFADAADAYTHGQIGRGILESAQVPPGGESLVNIGRELTGGQGGQALGDILSPIVAQGIPEKVAAARGPLARSAQSQYQNVVDPASANPQLAGRVTRELLDSQTPLRNPQEQLGPMMEQRANAVDTTTPILNRTEPATTEGITSALKDAKDSLYNTVAEVPLDGGKKATLQSLSKRFPDARLVVTDGDTVQVQQLRHPDMRSKVARLNQISRSVRNSASIEDTQVVPLGKDADVTVGQIKAQYPDAEVTIEPGWGWDRGDMGEAVVTFDRAPKSGEVGALSNDTLANLHSDYNYSAFNGKSPAELKALDQTNPDRWPGDVHAAKAIQSVVNQDPAAAAANAEKNFYLDAKNELPAGAKKDTLPSKGRVAGTLGAAIASEVAGAAIPGARPAISALRGVLQVGGAGSVGKLVFDALRSPAWQTRSAIVKSAMAKALASQDYQAAANIARGVLAADSQNKNNRQ